LSLAAPPAARSARRPAAEDAENRGWRDTIEDNVRHGWRVRESRAMTDATPINPQRVCATRDRRGA